MVLPAASIPLKSAGSLAKRSTTNRAQARLLNKNRKRPFAASPTRTLTKILVVHGSPVIRIGLTKLLRSSRAFRVCGETDDVAEAREFCARQGPAVVVMGLTLRRGDGIGLIKDLRKSAANIRVLVLSNRSDALSLQRSLRAGARGYVVTYDSVAEIPRALNAILAGEFYASRSVSRLLLKVVANGEMKPMGAESRLSDRELQVFRLIGRGLGATGVAKELHLSVKTIETHRMRIKQKLGLRCGAELNRRAESWLMSELRKRSRIL